ncbi:phospho-N-acetylmuramoyl-pentapeptide-transferase [Verrucomicrobiaceae bacterium SCGC AG-212-N21]|nr:phospho-N-acetylmuramoyl-pentapeptide-transferase [Verrucomicrobiaceae bacterium SCGC AG-212-N21]
MIYWLTELREHLDQESLVAKLLNVFHYHSFRAGGAFLTAFLLSLMFGERVIRKLISLKVGQPIRSKEEVQKLFDLHGKKAGTPTMGGVLMLGTFVVSVILWTDWHNRLVWIVLGTTLLLGLLGFWDDYEKVAKKNSKGVSARTKLVWQGGVAIIAAYLFAYCTTDGAMLTGRITFAAVSGPDNSTEMTDAILVPEQKQPVSYRSLFVPFMKDPLIDDMGIFALALFALIIIGASNAVNLTDGLDGLATGCSISTGIAYAAFCYLTSNVTFARFLFIPYFHQADELTIVAMAMVGACFGFLWFNCQPARMFMGDTGSLALGGAIATLAIGCKQEMLLLIVGGVFVMEAGSVILQVLSFKTRGVRIFRMSPIHHHFELGGWPESQVVVRFWMMSLIFALIGLSSLKLR